MKSGAQRTTVPAASSAAKRQRRVELKHCLSWRLFRQSVDFHSALAILLGWKTSDPYLLEKNHFLKKSSSQFVLQMSYDRCSYSTEPPKYLSD